MVLKMTDKQYYFPNGDAPRLSERSDAAGYKGPSTARPIDSAPTTYSIRVGTREGTWHWAIHRRESWREVAPQKDFKSGEVRWAETGRILDATSWSTSPHR
jgi:hypothetical protein